jgi:hypothetical protein
MATRAARQCHDFVCAHARVRGAAERFERSISPCARAGRAFGFADAGVVSSHLKLDLSMRQKA